MKTLRILALLSFAAVAISCQKEQHPRAIPGIYHKSNVEVKATASLPEGWAPMTKAVSDIIDVDNAELQSRGFGVYAFYTGTEEYSSATDSSAYSKFGMVLKNRKFQHTASAWENSGTAEFWPTSDGENLTLLAYAPWDTWNGLVQYDGKVPYIVYDDFVAQNLSTAQLEKQRDILWGTNTSGDPHRNVEKDDYDPEGTVDFHFRHAVAKVRLNVKGSLPGTNRTLQDSGSITNHDGSESPAENGETTSSVSDPVFEAGTRYESVGGWGNNDRYYYATLTETETESYIQTQYRTNTSEATDAIYSVQGQRYLIERVTLKGFNKTGTLLLDNESSYEPTWTNVTKFEGVEPEYVLTSSTVLSQALQYVPAATVQSNFNTYTGITEDAKDLMSGYYLYAIPRPATESDKIAVTIKYYKLNVDGTSTANQSREVVQYRTRKITRTRTRSKESKPVRVSRSWGSYNYPTSQSSYTFSSDYGEWKNWSSWSPNPSGDSNWGQWTNFSEGDWSITSEDMTDAQVSYDNETPAFELSGNIVTSLEGGRVYDINIIVAGDKIELDVVPQPWDLKEFEFDYNANINDVIQALTYDSSYIDYADNQGNVYINNRMGKFYFKLGAGKYASWQASLVGDAAFGFTDENGNWILDDHGNRVASIRGAVDPDVMNYLYIKPINTEATVTSHAKLRIYYIDATGDAVVALNLVNMDGVTEWTIWQNAN